MKRAIKAVALLAAVVMIASIAPVSASDRERKGPDAKISLDLGLRLRMLRQMEDLHAPREILEAITDEKAERIRQGRSVGGYPIHDMTNDGVAEIAEHDIRYSFVVGDQGQDLNSIAEDEYTTIIRIRDGATGKVHWKKRFDDFVLVGQARVGERGRPGLIAVAGILSFFSNSSGDRYLVFDGLRGHDGRRLWTKSYMSIAATHDYTTSVVTDSPVSFAFVQARKDAATEILLGLAQVAQATFSTMTAATRTLLLSAADGTEVMHPSIDVGVNWIPFPDAVPDLDGDSLDDYVVINDKGFAPGEGQELPELGGVIQARRGIDGGSIWTEGGHEFRYFAFTIPVGNVVGSRTRDFGVLTYNRVGSTEVLPSLPIVGQLSFPRETEVVMLVNGEEGNVLWTRQGWWMHSPGDLDRDGDDDLVIDRMSYRGKKNEITYTRLAYPAIGKLIWKHRLVWRGEPCVADTCLGGGGGGVGSAGDVHPDSITDRFASLALYQAHTGEQATFVLDGNSDRVLIRSDETMGPLGAAVDGRGTDVMNARVDRNETTVRAREGQDGDTIWTLLFSGSEQLLPKRSWAWGTGFFLPGDRCADVLVHISGEDNSFYAVVDGSSARVLWTRWTGKRAEEPRLMHRRNHNPC